MFCCVYTTGIHVLCCYILQVFNKDANTIDSVTGNHEKFLNLSDLGVRKKNKMYNIQSNTKH